MVQTFFGQRPPAGYPGMVADLGHAYDRSYINTALDVAGVITVTVATYAASTAYPLTINGVLVTHTSPATGGSATTVRDALVTAVNQSFAGVDAAAGAGATFTITGLSGQPLSVVLGTGNLTQATTTAVVTSGAIATGLAVVRLSTDSDMEARLGAASAAHLFLGVTLDSGFMTNPYPYTNSAHEYKRGDLMVVREAGGVWVTVETDVTPNSPVFYRYSGSGTIGAFRGATDTGADVRLYNARFMSSASAGGIAQLLLGYATYAGTLP